MNTGFDLFLKSNAATIVIAGYAAIIFFIGLGLYWANKEDKRRKKEADNHPKAFKPMKIGKVIDMKLDDFEDAISN